MFFRRHARAVNTAVRLLLGKADMRVDQKESGVEAVASIAARI
jgi:hypothetical protein